MRKKRIYIAGPMRGIEDNNYSAFIYAFDEFMKYPELRDAWEVVNPVEIGEGFGSAGELADDPKLLKRLMELELAAVKSCDAILLLRGWEKSEGARGELRVAIDNQLEIYTQESGVLIR